MSFRSMRMLLCLEAQTDPENNVGVKRTKIYIFIGHKKNISFHTFLPAKDN